MCLSLDSRRRWLLGTVLVLCAFPLTGCTSFGKGPVTRNWVAGAVEPAFDPDGPPHALRWSLERMLSRGLVEVDSAGRVIPAAAESVTVSADGSTWTFRLRKNLRFTDGSPASSADFQRALVGGLGREDHATRAWQLAAVTGVERVRAGKDLPALGIEAPDPRTLILKLSAPDTLLPWKLALPGVATPWKSRTGNWKEAVGLGPYRVEAEEQGRSLVLVRVPGVTLARASADTVNVRFVIGAPRLRDLLRRGVVDVAWPVPPGFIDQAPPREYRVASAPADPPRRLLLVFRADLRPTAKTSARHALAHATNRAAVLEALGASGREARGWIPGAGRFDFPRLDVAESQAWLARGKLGASVHVVLAYDLDRAGAEVARALQGEWARQGFYADLKGQRGAAALGEPLRATAAPAQLVESQALVPGVVGELAALVTPARGPAVGAFRTGWRTREFDPWLVPGRPAGPLDPSAVQSRLVEERNALPLAELPWIWIEREGPSVVRLSPRYGPEFAIPRPGEPIGVGSR